jgi:hypothetical protein
MVGPAARSFGLLFRHARIVPSISRRRAAAPHLLKVLYHAVELPRLCASLAVRQRRKKDLELFVAAGEVWRLLDFALFGVCVLSEGGVRQETELASER